MTLDEKISKIFDFLYELQVNQDIDWAYLPSFEKMCNDIIGNCSDNQLEILIEHSRKYINVHDEIFKTSSPISLKSNIISIIEKHGSYINYITKQPKPIELIQNYNNNFNGPTSITDSNFQSPNAKIEKIHGYDETINVINTLIENIRHNQDMEHIFKAQLVDIYTELLSIAQKSKESKLPIIEQIFSVAANIKNLFPFI